ncbi:STAS domain-containing protein [Streptomyces sp. NPDC014623]|uniref:STAS domain-containing protein n=1 Tax=Streptomyces sp. NPDC014623 TaxID=3364875 RepID=UPI003701682B
MRPRILALLEESDCRHLVLDLSRIDCFDSSGLAMLLGARHRSQTSGTTLTLAAPTPLISRMLSTTQTITVLSVAPSVHEALRPRPRAQGDAAQAADQA